jgi:Flp pilus assembly protein TadG
MSFQAVLLTISFLVLGIYLVFAAKASDAPISKTLLAVPQQLKRFVFTAYMPMSSFSRTLQAFHRDRKANVTLLFGLMSIMMMIGAGASIDLTRAYMARQKLVQTATLACQYAGRASIVDTSTSSYSGSGGGTAYVSAVNAFITTTLASQHIQYTQTTTSPFSYTQNGPANVTLTASVPTSFMKIINVNQMQIGATSHCYDNVNSLQQRVAYSGSANILTEGFENMPCGSTKVCWTLANGTSITYTKTGNIPLNNSFTSTVAYTGATGTQWYIMGYCLEVDTVNQITSTVPQGSHEAELDCDNGQGTAGNSSISTKVYLAAGNYELRYSFTSRIDYPNYDPVYLCGSAASDLSWANDTNSSGWSISNALRTNQINVYLDLNNNGTPPTHTTMVSSQTLAGSNLIDMCVHSNGWIQRSVRIDVTTAGYYWLSFAADGTSDSYGGQLDNIMLCQLTCTTSLQDNFPSTWVASNGSNVSLFEDIFESPAQSFGCYNCGQSNVNLYASTGTSGSSSGWPSQSSSGWAIGPYNQIDYYSYLPTQGSQYIELDGSLHTIYGTSTTEPTSNRSISRAFLLDPGYYEIDYDYVSDLTFSGITAANCTAAPTAANAAAFNTFGNQTGTAINRINGASFSGTYYNTNFVAAFMANGQLVSTPNASSTQEYQTTYTNPDGSTASSYSAATSPLDYVDLSNYNVSQSNPLIDFCAYAPSWQTRTTYVEITKPGYYWLTFSALGQIDKIGGAIDDVKLTALGSLYMSSPPSNPVLIPVPSPQNGATTSFTGFSIVSDPLTPPAALQ